MGLDLQSDLWVSSPFPVRLTDNEEALTAGSFAGAGRLFFFVGGMSFSRTS